MIPRFRLARPDSLQAAFVAFDAANGEAAYYAGGTELLQVMKAGLAQYGTLIDLKRIPELRGVEVDQSGLRVGALTTHREIERSMVVGRAAPCFAAVERLVANGRVRGQGTIGGNLAFAEPHSDPATLLLAGGGYVELVGPNGSRSIAMAEFSLGPFATVRENCEIVRAIWLPARRPGVGQAYERIVFFERPAVSVAVTLSLKEGKVWSASVAVGSATEVPMLVPSVAEAMIGLPAELSALSETMGSARDAIWSLGVVADLNGSAEYKAHLAAVLLRRAVAGALREATANA